MLLLLLVFSVIFSCTKEDSAPATGSTENANDFALVDENGNLGYYFYDGHPIKPSEFNDYYTPGLTVIHGSEEQTEFGPKEVYFHSFSTLEQYFEHSDRVGAHAREYYEFDQKIEAVNQEMDIENTYFGNLEVQAEYNRRIGELYMALPDKLRAGDITPASSEQKVLVRLYRDCVPFPGNGNDGPFTPGLGLMPFLGNLNNEVSMFGRFAFAVNFIFDRWFYNRRMATITTLGMETVPFCPGRRFFPLNDRMSSGIFGGA